MLLMRDNVPHAGWTRQEAVQLQQHICHVWWPTVKRLLMEIYSPEDADCVARVLKLHLLLCHATEKLMSMGPLGVRTPLSPCLIRVRTLPQVRSY